jgi:hypothetical protein
MLVHGGERHAGAPRYFAELDRLVSVRYQQVEDNVDDLPGRRRFRYSAHGSTVTMVSIGYSLRFGRGYW